MSADRLSAGTSERAELVERLINSAIEDICIIEADVASDKRWGDAEAVERAGRQAYIAKVMEQLVTALRDATKRATAAEAQVAAKDEEISVRNTALLLKDREIAQLTKQVETMRAALEPFADYANTPHIMDGTFEGEIGEYYRGGLRVSISFAALRVARFALAPAQQMGEPK